ncbi:ribosomal-protein-alanine N-acetyltransferase [Collimonas sp. OK242]|jgi:ribosomal-protein-alanine N-acetyltransferase|nr:ribosomal-protein-alanine N-acetyltransferase [Collimonas sp. OK242]
MREIAATGIRYIFDVIGLHRIMANHVPANVRSEISLLIDDGLS